MILEEDIRSLRASMDYGLICDSMWRHVFQEIDLDTSAQEPEVALALSNLETLEDYFICSENLPERAIEFALEMGREGRGEAPERWVGAWMAQAAVQQASADLAMSYDDFHRRVFSEPEEWEWHVTDPAPASGRTRQLSHIIGSDIFHHEPCLTVKTPLGLLIARMCGDPGLYDGIAVDLVDDHGRLLQLATIETKPSNRRALADGDVEFELHALAWDGISEDPSVDQGVEVGESSYWYESADRRDSNERDAIGRRTQRR